MKANIAAYQAICALADSLKWPEKYRNDLYKIDREYLTGAMGSDAPESFGIAIRPNGTVLDDPRRQDLTRDVLRRIYTSTFRDCRFYWFAYGFLREYDLESYLDRFENWQCMYQEHWSDAWTAYFKPAR
jgi:hypothetical protein